MQPGTVRTIEYEIVSRSEAERIGPPVVDAQPQLSTMAQVAVLRCVDDRGQKLTAVGDATQLRSLLASGAASDPSGMALQEQHFPVIVSGWPKAS
jgi:hypothetical protein